MKRLLLILLPYLLTTSIFAFILFFTADRKEKRQIQNKTKQNTDTLLTDSVK
jgi:hypothetical protein